MQEDRTEPIIESETENQLEDTSDKADIADAEGTESTDEAGTRTAGIENGEAAPGGFKADGEAASNGIEAGEPANIYGFETSEPAGINAIEAGGEEKISLGLGLSDTDDYYVNDGVDNTSEYRDTAGRRGSSGDSDYSDGGRSLAAFLSGIVFCMAVILVCTYVLGIGRIIPDKKYKYYRELDDSYGKYYQIMKMIGSDPLAEGEIKDIDDDTLKEIVESTGDPYAQYFTAEEYAEFEKRYVGDYVGIGVGVVEEDGKIMIKSVFSDSPAEDAGILAGDEILKVDGKEPSGVDDAIDMITGEPGTRLVVTVGRGDETLDFTLNRAKIEAESVAYTALEDEPEIGYIQISSFRRGTDDDFKLAVRDLEAKGCTSFIIDLRDNGGGLTDVSIEIADYLLPACTIMSERTKDGKETVYSSKASSADLDCAVLVNGNTASASEILSAALQDNDGAVIIGSKTYGKGVTQTSYKFSDGSAVKLTQTEYFRPSGEKVNGIGITPDIETDEEDAFDEAIRELRK